LRSCISETNNKILIHKNLWQAILHLIQVRIEI
jgi:hypothetical protein